jgi:hypothetical protein
MPESRGIVATLTTAIDDYAEFPTDELKEAVTAALRALDTDLTENGYQQSERADNAAARIEAEMNEADSTEAEVGEEEADKS